MLDFSLENWLYNPLPLIDFKQIYFYIYLFQIIDRFGFKN